jgi:methyl-accepting chemotaxis protein
MGCGVAEIHGYGLMSVTSQAFNKVADSANRAAELLAEISTASKEQSLGIGQLNTAVGEMDKVTQQNAANSEESAASSEQLAGQAEQMRVMVDELMNLLEAKEKRAAAETTATTDRRKDQNQNGMKGTLHAIAGNAVGH